MVWHQCICSSLSNLINQHVICTELEIIYLKCHFQGILAIKNVLFGVAGPRMWNDLPLELRTTTSPGALKSKLKTSLFRQYYFQSLHFTFHSFYIYIFTISFIFNIVKRFRALLVQRYTVWNELLLLLLRSDLLTFIGQSVNCISDVPDVILKAEDNSCKSAEHHETEIAVGISV